MAKEHDPERLLVESLDELAAWVRESGDTNVTVSWGTAWKLRVMRIIHPFGFHYLVPLRRFDSASGRLIDIGTTCWFCDG